ncbi:MAG: type II toxin-antitoxin system RelE/ParE family toxin [Candidatus Bipolaricaulota bacterium]|nr:type II toxin-antitoxin system RelE/ParE family toxin [Candidatus Bipolaricaulota bacterium]
MAWTVGLTPEARKQLGHLPRDQQRRIQRAIDRMCDDPFQGNVKPLKGDEWKGLYRRVVGRYRIFFLPIFRKRHIEIISIRLRAEKTYR